MKIERRNAIRQAFCRGCDCTIEVGQQMVTTFSRRNRGQFIHFCLDCANDIGELASQEVKP